MCFFLGNYASWIVKFDSNFPQKSKLQEIKEILVSALQDSNKRCQEAACRAILQFLREQCQFEALLPALFWGLARFQVRNRRLIYAIICQVAPQEFEAAEWTPVFELLIERFDNQSIQDSSVFPLIEALVALQPRAAFSQNLFTKACALAFNALKTTTSTTMPFSESFLTAALDLLDAMAEAHPQSAQKELLVSILQETFAKAEEGETLQSAFALFGDAWQVAPFPSYWAALRANFRPTSIFPASGNRIVSLATASNAIWSFGLLFVKGVSFENDDFSYWARQIQADLLAIVKEKPRIPLGCRIYYENLAIALGRSACFCPLSHLETGLRDRILQILENVEDCGERESALKHLCK